jgi:hypothetical protein
VHGAIWLFVFSAETRSTEQLRSAKKMQRRILPTLAEGRHFWKARSIPSGIRTQRDNHRLALDVLRITRQPMPKWATSDRIEFNYESQNSVSTNLAQCHSHTYPPTSSRHFPALLVQLCVQPVMMINHDHEGNSSLDCRGSRARSLECVILINWQAGI